MIFPAIDLMDGRCVRLFQGDFSRRSEYDISPIAMAEQFARSGADWLHVVDLDGARNQQSGQSELIIQIAKQSGLQVQTGGGLREWSQVQHLLDNGISRVVIGSLAIRDPDRIARWADKLESEKLVLALDVHVDSDGTPWPTSHGWQKRSKQTLWHVMQNYLDLGLRDFLVTDIAKDGALQGANLDLYRDIMRRYPLAHLITSGGVGSLDDVRALKALTPAGIIIGKALYENEFTLAEAISC
ncbi:MAG: 1-(5-phosphoribosyl)-5-[(5-phosphoribosylamino)methylideneamino]imidazole-4-carboxamide isomerase [Robiginitomaculum sp.]|nr:MAG: 1-(5-phosphoribosyl)-5-[(5-phosphoribosylamino)methylideneamino]imidazole-4-carboxamide isomerase [Robiginitomaculum sp.]